MGSEEWPEPTVRGHLTGYGQVPRWPLSLKRSVQTGHEGPLLHDYVTAPLPHSLKPFLLQDSARLLTGERPELTQQEPQLE